MRYFLILFLIFFGILNAQDRVITTGVPFLMISPDALRKIKQILIAKKMADKIDTLDNQWGKIIDGIQDRKNSITIETKKDKEKEGK